ncbi:MAG: hypothetical protein H6818_05200 [Phycisphaerales bacterium]|nr:hypothetical protein [Phycisphaerales bacterium]MCB9863418.1 hypothetical protein [Phycisphaerales bacterium]
MFVRKTALFATAVTLLVAVPASSEDYSIARCAIAGGGGSSAGGDFDLEGTIGQHDAGYMSGGDLELSGGYWTSQSTGCPCPGDANGDRRVNGADVQSFVQCLLTPGVACRCADVDAVQGMQMSDVTVFVDILLTANDCP